MHITRWAIPIALIVAGLVATAAAQADSMGHLGPASQTGKDPVIIIPGLEGTELLQRDGSHAWFSVHRGKGDDLRLPVSSTVLSRNRDSLRPGDIIRKVEVKFFPDIEVYQAVIDSLQSKGYKEATWAHPQATDVYYVFPYDWRRDNVENAQILMQRMTSVKARLRRPQLKFDIIAHSMGGLIARYAAMYGSADLSANPVPTWAGAAHINKLMMFGTPNEGSFAAFRALLDGEPVVANRKLPFIDDFRPEDIFTLPSVYQLMPDPANARFLDENLQPIKVDLYNPATWEKYGWGALADPKFLSKLKDAPKLALTNKDIKPKPFDGKGNADDRLVSQLTSTQARAFFAAALERARRFHAALDAPSKKQPVQIFLYGGNCTQTIDGAVIVAAKDGKWETIVDDKEFKNKDGKTFKKDEVRAAIFSLGDSRVPWSSLVGSDKPLTADSKIEFFGASYPLASSYFTCGSHTKLFLEKPIQDSFLSALVVAKQGQP
jgi:hypothetical protein